MKFVEDQLPALIDAIDLAGDVCRTELSELVGEGVGLLACIVRQI